MANLQLNVPPFSGICGATDLTNREGQAVKYVGGVWVPCGAGESGFPLLQGAAPGRAISIANVGNLVEAVASAAIAVGAKVTAAAGGKYKTAVATSVSGAAVLGSNIHGIALSATSAVDQVFTMLVMPLGADVTTPS